MWILQSNRWKHLVGGILLGAASDGLYCAALVGLSTAGALEYKDHAHGCAWDWWDFAMTVVGAGVGYALRFLILKKIC